MSLQNQSELRKEDDEKLRPNSCLSNLIVPCKEDNAETPKKITMWSPIVRCEDSVQEAQRVEMISPIIRCEDGVEEARTVKMISPIIRCEDGVEEAQAVKMISPIIRCEDGVEEARTVKMISPIVRCEDSVQEAQEKEMISPIIRCEDSVQEPQEVKMISPIVRCEDSVQEAQEKEMISPIIRCEDSVQEPQEVKMICPIIRCEDSVQEAQRVKMISPIIRREDSVQEPQEPQEVKMICPIIRCEDSVQEVHGVKMISPIVRCEDNIKNTNTLGDCESVSLQSADEKLFSNKPSAPSTINMLVPANISEEERLEGYRGEISESAGGIAYWNADKECYVRVCNYIPRVRRVLVCKSKIHGERQRIEMEIYVAQGGCVNISVWSWDLPSLNSILKKRYVQVFLSGSKTKAEMVIDQYVAQQINNFRPIVIFEDAGWQKWQNQHTYFHDGIELNGTECHSGKRMIPIHNNALRAFEDALRFLKISDDLEKILLPFLFAHLGLLYSLFEDAGYPLRFLLFVNGTTGSLKTAVCKVLFHLFNGEGPSIPATFKDTVASLELKMSKTSDSVLLLDDFHPAGSKGEEANMKKTLESLIRFFGDGIGKARATSSMDVVKETKPCGLCAITGEDIGGSMSSLLRCVLVNVDSGTFKGPLLEPFQENPDVLLTHYSHFVSYIGWEYDHIVNYIHENFNKYRALFNTKLQARRLSDAGANLCLMADIITSYASAIGYQQEVIQAAHWHQAIIDALIISEASSKDMNPVIMYLYAVQAITMTKSALIAPNESIYRNNIDQYVGFEDGAYWWLDPDRNYRLVVKYWQQSGKYFSLSQPKIHAALYNSGCLVVPHQNKVTKYLCRTSFPPRPYYLKVNREMMLSLLELSGEGR